MTIDGWITKAARKAPDRTAIEFSDQCLSYADFNALIQGRAAQLHAQGIGRGDRIAWLGFNAPEVFVLLFAAARLGAMLVPLNWRLADAEVAGILHDCAPKILFHDEKARDRARTLAPDIANDVWSEGTGNAPATGHPETVRKRRMSRRLTVHDPFHVSPSAAQSAGGYVSVWKKTGCV